MDTSILRGPLCTDRQIRGTPFAVDTFQEKICVVRCIHAQDRRAWIRMSKKTHTNPLSKREIEALRKNPNVAAVSATTVKFTEEFKRFIYEGKKQGVSVAATLRQNGIAPEMLGPSRVEGLSYSLNKKAKQQNSFADRRSEHYRRPPKICYLSPILDACTHKALAYQLSDNLRVDFVLNTVDALCAEYGAELDNTTIVHSDQGCHYTSNAFIQKLRDKEFVQSMSRKGNCWDNAPQESFFGHMKDEIAELIAECDTYSQVVAIVDDWMDYYNNDRYQWDLEKLSPREYYRYRQTGVYPLKPGVSKCRNFRGAAPDPEV